MYSNRIRKKNVQQRELQRRITVKKKSTDGTLQGIYIIRQTIHHSHATVCSHDSQKFTFLLFLTFPPLNSRHLLLHILRTSRDFHL